MNRLVTSFALVGMATFAATAHADTAPPSAVSLLTDPTALAEWLRDHDAEVIASGARIEAAMAAERQAHVVPNPSLSLGYGGLVLGGFNWGGATPTQNVSFFSTPQITVGIGELIELGKRGPRGQAAELRAKEAVESAVGILGGRVSDATAALGKLAYLSAKHATLAANLADAKHLLALEKIRLDHDDLSGADYQRIELETQRIELDMDRADADQTSARAACEAAVYATCTVEGFDESTLSSAAQVPVVPDVTAAVIARPALAAARMEASALGHDAELAHARRIPDPTVGISYTWDDMPSAVGDQANTLMFSVSLPLALFDRGTHDAAAALANAKVIAAEELVTRRRSLGDVSALMTLRTSLERTIKRLHEESIPKSADLLKKSRASFDLGESDLSDLLVAERGHRDLLLQVIDAEFELFQTRSTLRQDLGLDDEAARGAVSGRMRISNE